MIRIPTLVRLPLYIKTGFQLIEVEWRLNALINWFHTNSLSESPFTYRYVDPLEQSLNLQTIKLIGKYRLPNHVHFVSALMCSVETCRPICHGHTEHFALWWRQNETFSALLVLCNSPVTGEFPSQRPVTRSCDIFFDRHLNKRLGKQSICKWFEMPWRSLWRHCNVLQNVRHVSAMGVGVDDFYKTKRMDIIIS